MQYIIKIIRNKRIHVPLALRGSGLCKEPPCFITWLQMSGTRKERDFGERDREKGKPDVDLEEELQQNAANLRLRSLPATFQSTRVTHLKGTEGLLKVAVPCRVHYC